MFEVFSSERAAEKAAMFLGAPRPVNTGPFFRAREMLEQTPGAQFTINYAKRTVGSLQLGLGGDADAAGAAAAGGAAVAAAAVRATRAGSGESPAALAGRRAPLGARAESSADAASAARRTAALRLALALTSNDDSGGGAISGGGAAPAARRALEEQLCALARADVAAADAALATAWRRLADCRGFQWRHGARALRLLEALLLRGPETALCEVLDRLNYVRSLGARTRAGETRAPARRARLFLARGFARRRRRRLPLSRARARLTLA